MVVITILANLPTKVLLQMSDRQKSYCKCLTDKSPTVALLSGREHAEIPSIFMVKSLRHKYVQYTYKVNGEKEINQLKKRGGGQGPGSDMSDFTSKDEKRYIKH